MNSFAVSVVSSSKQEGDHWWSSDTMFTHHNLRIVTAETNEVAEAMAVAKAFDSIRTKYPKNFSLAVKFVLSVKL